MEADAALSSGDPVVLPTSIHCAASNLARYQLLAMVQVLLSRYSLEEDIVVGSMHPTRSDPGLQAVLGCLTHSFAMRTDLSGALLRPRTGPRQQLRALLGVF